MSHLLRDLSRRDLALIGLPLLALLALAVWGVTHYVEPAPPKTVVMSTGPLDGAYHAFAERYKALFAQYGVTLELKPSAGAVENVERLKTRKDGASLALVQGGIANAENAPGLVTFGSVFYEPNWIFYRGELHLDAEQPLRGKRIAIGRPAAARWRWRCRCCAVAAWRDRQPCCVNSVAWRRRRPSRTAKSTSCSTSPQSMRLACSACWPRRACICWASGAPRPMRGACRT